MPFPMSIAPPLRISFLVQLVQSIFTLLLPLSCSSFLSLRPLLNFLQPSFPLFSFTILGKPFTLCFRLSRDIMVFFTRHSALPCHVTSSFSISCLLKTTPKYCPLVIFPSENGGRVGWHVCPPYIINLNL